MDLSGFSVLWPDYEDVIDGVKPGSPTDTQHYRNLHFKFDKLWISPNGLYASDIPRGTSVKPSAKKDKAKSEASVGTRVTARFAFNTIRFQCKADGSHNIAKQLRIISRIRDGPSIKETSVTPAWGLSPTRSIIFLKCGRGIKFSGQSWIRFALTTEIFYAELTLRYIGGLSPARYTSTVQFLSGTVSDGNSPFRRNSRARCSGQTRIGDGIELRSYCWFLLHQGHELHEA